MPIRQILTNPAGEFRPNPIVSLLARALSLMRARREGNESAKTTRGLRGEILPMKWLPIGITLLVLMMAIPANGQAPAENGTSMRYSGGITPGEVTATPEMWFYQEQMNRRDDPHEAVRRKAEFRTAQREARLASRRWFGVSLMRPLTSTATMNGETAAVWTGGDPFYPYRWYGTTPVIVVNRFDRARSTY